MKPPPHSLLLLLLASAALRLSSASTSPYPDETRPTKSGYLTVGSKSSMFYAYYESQTPPNKTTPILIWLQGGPGCSSMLANFFELGPFLLNQNLTLSPNPFSWNSLFALLFLDSPIGTGFSTPSDPQQIPRDQQDISNHLITAITQFISLNPSFPTRPIYIAGESYAGKYNPSLAYSILKHNSAGKIKRINLAGISIGNGLTDPATQVQTHAATCLNLGLINRKQSTLVEEFQSKAVEFAKQMKWKESADARNDVFGNIQNMTGLETLYDFRRLTVYQTKVVSRFLNQTQVQEALGVKKWRPYYTCSKAVIAALHEDVMKSVRDKVEFLVANGVKILLYQGNSDLRDGVFSTVSWIEKMKGDVIDGFLKAERKVWTSVDKNLAGYVQKYKNFTHVVVMNAGHLVPADQPMNSQTMIQDWVLDKNLFA